MTDMTPIPLRNADVCICAPRYGCSKCIRVHRQQCVYNRMIGVLYAKSIIPPTSRIPHHHHHQSMCCISELNESTGYSRTPVSATTLFSSFLLLVARVSDGSSASTAIPATTRATPARRARAVLRPAVVLGTVSAHAFNCGVQCNAACYQARTSERQTL
jgi:hypothetical protein